ncbi:class I SAM-dependent methyltransferase [Fibrobacterota bacterium]
MEGQLGCSQCDSVFEINNYLPRFVSMPNYADSFGSQWNKHAKTQIDSFSGVDMSRDRFFMVTGWPKELKGQRMLEAGSGAGRFTHVALETGAKLFSFDLSNSVDVNREANGGNENLCLFQGDIYNIPLNMLSFDKIFCFGVLQHCPDPKKAFMNLVDYLKPGGELVVDIYDLTIRAFFNPKYWLRPLSKRIASETLYRIVHKVVPKLFPIKMGITERLPYGKYFAFFIPVAYHKGFIPKADNLTYEQLLEWSILDTFDKFASQYDKPQTLKTVKRWFNEAGLDRVSVRYGPNGIIGRGSKP